MDFADDTAAVPGAQQNNILNHIMGSGPDDDDGIKHRSNGQSVQPFRIVGPTQEQWTNIKDIFTKLYLVENRKLKDVRDILSRNLGFNASEKMYKRRITEWKIRKNYKAKDKEILAKRVKAFVAAGHDVQSLSFHGRPIKLDRVKRHCRSDKRLTQIWEHLSQSPEAVSVGDVTVKNDSPSSAPAKLTPIQNAAAWSELSDAQMEGDNEHNTNNLLLSISSPTDFKIVESALFHTHEAIQWQFTAFKPLTLKQLHIRFPGSVSQEVRAGCTDLASALWLALDQGFRFLETGRPKDAGENFGESCKMVQPLILSSPIQLLSCLLLHFATSWKGMDQWEQHILEYVSSMASNVLGPWHPLAKALRMIAMADVREHAIEHMMNLVVRGYSSRRKAENSSLFALRVDQIDVLRKRKNFEQAHALCQQLITDSRSMRQKRYRSALAALGRLYADQGEEFAVEGVAHRILEDEASEAVTCNSSTTTWACDQLASLSMNRREYRIAEEYLRRATYISYLGYLHRGPSTMSFLRRLESCILLQGRDVNIAKVCNEMGIDMNRVQG